MTRTGLLLALVMLAGGPACPAAERVLTVFAAASLTEVLDEAGAAYTRRSGVPVRFSFAASSLLARQVESGARADAIIPADEQWMDYLAQRGLIQRATRANVASNALVLVAPAESRLSLEISPGFPLARALGTHGRLAMADPRAVPAGRYGQVALTRLGVWDSVSGRIIAADNVRTALNFVALGEAPLGIVYATDVRGNARVKTLGTFPAGSHEPITYPAAVLSRGDARAQDFLRFLSGSEGRAIFARHGFGPP